MFRARHNYDCARRTRVFAERIPAQIFAVLHGIVLIKIYGPRWSVLSRPLRNFNLCGKGNVFTLMRVLTRKPPRGMFRKISEILCSFKILTEFEGCCVLSGDDVVGFFFFGLFSCIEEVFNIIFGCI